MFSKENSSEVISFHQSSQTEDRAMDLRFKKIEPKPIRKNFKQFLYDHVST